MNAERRIFSVKRIIYLLTVLALILTFSGCTRKEIKESVLNEDETAKEKNIVDEDNGKHEEQTVKNTEERETGIKEEIKRDEEIVEIKPKKRRVKIIKN